jgi:hypothetical protein
MAAEAAPASTTTAAPAPNGASGAQHSEGKPTKTTGDPEESPDVWSVFDQALKKDTRGAGVKVHGKERFYKSADTIKQRLSLTDAFEAKVQQLENDNLTAKQRAALMDQLEEADPEKFFDLLEQRYGKKVFEAARVRFKKLIDKDKEEAALTENERRLKAQAEQAEERAAKLERDQRTAKEKEDNARFEAQTRHQFQQIARITAEATKDMGLKASAAPYITPHIAATIARNDSLGIETSPQDIARAIHGAMGEMSGSHMSALTDDGLLDHLLATKTKDDDGKTESSLFMRSLRAYQARRRARKSVDDGEVENAPPEEKPDRGQTKRVSQDNRRSVMDVFRPPAIVER